MKHAKLSDMTVEEFLAFVSSECDKIDQMLSMLHPSVALCVRLNLGYTLCNKIKASAVDARCRSLFPANNAPQAAQLEGLPPELVWIWAADCPDVCLVYTGSKKNPRIIHVKRPYPRSGQQAAEVLYRYTYEKKKIKGTKEQV